MIRLIASGMAVTLVCTAAPAQEAAPALVAPTVEIELREGDQLIGAPTIRLQVGRPAAVALGSYSLRMRLARAEASDGAAPYVLRSSVYRSDSGWALVASPVMTVTQGEQSRLSFAGSDGSALSMAVTLR